MTRAAQVAFVCCPPSEEMASRDARRFFLEPSHVSRWARDLSGYLTPSCVIVPQDDRDGLRTAEKHFLDSCTASRGFGFFPMALYGRIIPLSEFGLESRIKGKSRSLGRSLRRASRDDTWRGGGHAFRVLALPGLRFFF
jgi:hypothetical protein